VVGTGCPSTITVVPGSKDVPDIIPEATEPASISEGVTEVTTGTGFIKVRTVEALTPVSMSMAVIVTFVFAGRLSGA
jgi:hypothetical protein